MQTHAYRKDRHKTGTEDLLGRSGAAGGRRRLRDGLVAVEMALAITAIVAAGLFLKSFGRVSRVEPGFDAEKVAVGQFSMGASGFDAAQADAFCSRLRERLERNPRQCKWTWCVWLSWSTSTVWFKGSPPWAPGFI